MSEAWIVPPGCVESKPAELLETSQRFEQPIEVFFVSHIAFGSGDYK